MDETFVESKHAASLRKLEHRTHSCSDDDVITGEPWVADAGITVKQWPAGDVSVIGIERRLRQAKVVRPKRTTGKLSDEDADRGNRRAKKRIWESCQRLQANCLLTLTKRGGFVDLDQAWACKEAVVAELTARGWIGKVLSVPELHDGSRTDGDRIGANVGSWHMHIATNAGWIPFAEMHAAVAAVDERFFGHTINEPADKLINVNVSKKRGRRLNKHHTPASIAGYLSQYLGDELEDSQAGRELNRKRFEHSRGLAKPQVVRLRFNPGDISGMQHAVETIINRLKGRRQGTKPHIVSIGDCTKVVMQSAIDWGTGPEDLSETLVPLPSAAELWELIKFKRGMRQRGASTYSGATRDAPSAPFTGKPDKNSTLTLRKRALMEKRQTLANKPSEAALTEKLKRWVDEMDQKRRSHPGDVDEPPF